MYQPLFASLYALTDHGLCEFIFWKHLFFVLDYACQQERINDDQHMLETNMIYAEIQSEDEITVNDRTITDHVRGTWHALGCTRLIIS